MPERRDKTSPRSRHPSINVSATDYSRMPFVVGAVVSALSPPLCLLRSCFFPRCGEGWGWLVANLIRETIGTRAPPSLNDSIAGRPRRRCPCTAARPAVSAESACDVAAPRSRMTIREAQSRRCAGYEGFAGGLCDGNAE